MGVFFERVSEVRMAIGFKLRWPCSHLIIPRDVFFRRRQSYTGVTLVQGAKEKQEPPYIGEYD